MIGQCIERRCQTVQLERRIARQSTARPSLQLLTNNDLLLCFVDEQDKFAQSTEHVKHHKNKALMKLKPLETDINFDLHGTDELWARKLTLWPAAMSSIAFITNLYMGTVGRAFLDGGVYTLIAIAYTLMTGAFVWLAVFRNTVQISTIKSVMVLGMVVGTLVSGIFGGLSGSIWTFGLGSTFLALLFYGLRAALAVFACSLAIALCIFLLKLNLLGASIPLRGYEEWLTYNVQANSVIMYVWITGLITATAYNYLSAYNTSLEKNLKRRLELEELEKTNKFIISAATDGICWIDKNGSIVDVSPSLTAIFGLSKEEILGSSAAKLKEHIAPGDANIRRADERTIECTIPNKEGRELQVELKILDWIAKSGEILGEIVLVKDLTVAKSMYALLANKQKIESMGQLIGGVAHDFNNLLAITMGKSEFIMNAADNIEISDIKVKAQEIVDVSNRGAKLVKRLLSYVQPRPPDPINTELDQFLSDFEDILRDVVGDGIELVMELDSPNIFINLDPDMLHSALTNLTINAKHALKTGGKLIIRTSRKFSHKALSGKVSDPVCIEFYDNGMGMSPEVLERACEPFYTTKAIGTGYGLGLAEVSRFIKETGGEIRISSVEGKETSIRLYLPIAVNNDSESEIEYEESEKKIVKDTSDFAVKKLRILLVEDSKQLRTLLAEVLTSFDYEVKAVTNAADAIDTLNTSMPYDLVVSDIVIPGNKSGIDVCRYARSLFPDLKIIFISGYFDENLLKAAFSLDDVDILRKPFRPSELARLVGVKLAA